MCCLRVLLLGAVSREVKAMAVHPAATVATVLHYGGLLPRDLSADLQRRRLIRRELVEDDDDNRHFLFRIIVGIVACFW